MGFTLINMRSVMTETRMVEMVVLPNVKFKLDFTVITTI